MVAYIIGMWAALPGFINAVSGMEVHIVWRRFYQIGFFFGYLVSGILFYFFNRIAPPPGLGIQVSFDIDGMQIVESVPEGMEKDVVTAKNAEVDVERVSTR